MPRSTRLPAVLLGLAAAALAAAHPAGAAAPPGLLSETLDNGLRVTVLADPDLPVVATQVWYHVGSANEDPDNRGFAHLFEHFMFGATENHGKEDYERHHHRHGGYENAYTSADETVYLSLIAPEQHGPVLAMEADRMVNLLLDEENFENEKRIVLEELRVRYENDPFSRVFIAAQKAVLGDHPYAYDPQGSKEDVAAAGLDQARRFYETFYRPRNVHLVIVGPVDGPATLGRVRELFGSLPAAGSTPPDVPALAGWDFPAETVLREDLPPAETCVFAYPLPGPGSRDEWALLVLAELLGGGPVDLFEEELVTRRNKAVYAGVEWMAMRRGGFLLLTSAHLPHRRKATAFRLTRETLETLGRLEWLTDESLAAAKRALRRRELRATYYAGALAGDLGNAAWWHGDERLAFERAERIGAVTREEVAEAFRAHVLEAEPVRLYIRPERIPLWIRLFGWIYPLVS